MEKKKFQKLKTLWYDKLKASGFVDIENEEGAVKPDVDPRTAKNAFRMQHSTEAYYKKAVKFLETGTLSSVQKQIWSLHCEGIGAVRISKKLCLKIGRVDNVLIELKKLAGLSKK